MCGFKRENSFTCSASSFAHFLSPSESAQTKKAHKKRQEESMSLS